MISFLVIFKKAIRFNVVYVKVLIHTIFCLAATLASKIISCSGLASLFVPVGATITVKATCPSCIVISNIPTIKTGGAAEITTRRLNPTTYPGKFFAAVLAIGYYLSNVSYPGALNRAINSHVFVGSKGLVTYRAYSFADWGAITFLGAIERSPGIYISGLFVSLFSAGGTRNIITFFHTKISAFYGTKEIMSPCHFRRLSLEFLVANQAIKSHTGIISQAVMLGN